MWRASIPGPDDILRLRRVRKKFGLRPLVVHANYIYATLFYGEYDAGQGYSLSRGAEGSKRTAASACDRCLATTVSNDMSLSCAETRPEMWRRARIDLHRLLVYVGSGGILAVSDVRTVLLRAVFQQAA